MESRMHRSLGAALLCLSATGCGGGSSPTTPSGLSPATTSAIVPASAKALFGSGAVDLARCLAGTQDSACLSAARLTSSVVSTAAVPLPPATLTATIAGNTVNLAWTAPSSGDAVLSYIIEAGSTPGVANLAAFPTGNTSTSYIAAGVPAGTYYVRVRSQNGSGIGSASNEVVIVVGTTGCATAPNTPTGLTSSVVGSTITLTWVAPTGGCAPSSYLLEAGSSSGLANLANFATGSSATSYVAPGVATATYYVRVRAQNSYGRSAASNEIVAVVGTTVPLPFGVNFGPDVAQADQNTIRLAYSLAQGFWSTTSLSVFAYSTIDEVVGAYIRACRCSLPPYGQQELASEFVTTAPDTLMVVVGTGFHSMNRELLIGSTLIHSLTHAMQRGYTHGFIGPVWMAEGGAEYADVHAGVRDVEAMHQYGRTEAMNQTFKLSELEVWPNNSGFSSHCGSCRGL